MPGFITESPTVSHEVTFLKRNAYGHFTFHKLMAPVVDTHPGKTLPHGSHPPRILINFFLYPAVYLSACPSEYILPPAISLSRA